MKKRVIALFFCLLIFSGCASQPTPTATPSPMDEARETLVRFFDLLHSKQYAEADALYGGDYEQLQIFNADADPSDHAALWAWSCEMSGLQCLKARNAVINQQQGDTLVFLVEFSNPDGSQFILGPCCGATEEEMPPVSQFTVHVTKNSDGKFLVMDMPPYVP